MTKDEALQKGKELFFANAKPPKDALKEIQAGRLKGKSDINPQWRIEAMTNTYGLYGTGWYFQTADVKFVDVPATGELLVFMTIELFIKDLETGKWAKPVVGVGGDFVIRKEKNILHGNDEAYAMCLTDALGKAMKVLGVASDVYRGKFDTKAGREDAASKPPENHDRAFRRTEKGLFIKGACGEKNINELPIEHLLAIVNFTKFLPIKAEIEARIKELQKEGAGS